MKKLAFLFFLSVLALIPLSKAKADGAFLSPQLYYTYETDQKAVIVHENDQETLILSTGFQGNARDFAWIIPTPSRPKAEEAADNLFSAIDNLTQPKNTRFIQLTADKYLGVSGINKEGDTVSILENKQVGIFNTKVLTSNSAKALTDWLIKNNYPYPTEYSYVLDSYVKQG